MRRRYWSLSYCLPINNFMKGSFDVQLNHFYICNTELYPRLHNNDNLNVFERTETFRNVFLEGRHILFEVCLYQVDYHPFLLDEHFFYLQPEVLAPSKCKKGIEASYPP